MRRCAVLLHPDADYAGRLADFWNQRKSLGLPVYAFSALEAFRAFRARADVELLLFSEHFADEMQGLLGQSMAILLSEDGFVSERCQNALPVPAVFSYRPADALARRVMQLYATARPGALSLGLARAAQGKTLLLSLEDYAGVYAQIAPDAAESLSELLFAHSSNRYSWAVLQSRLSAFGALDLLPPVRCAEDLSLLPPEEFAALLQRIARESGYRSMVLDFGAFGRRALELLELCDRIFMPVLSDPLSALKLNSFREYLRQSGRAQLLEKTETLELPPETEKAQDYACALLPAYESGPLYEMAAALH